MNESFQKEEKKTNEMIISNDLILYRIIEHSFTKKHKLFKRFHFFQQQQHQHHHKTSIQCAEQAGLPYEQILECYSSDIGTQLQLDAEAKTKQLAEPREMLSFVPTIVYNHVRIKI